MWTWSRKELKTNAKAALKRSFWKDLLALIIVGLLLSSSSHLSESVLTDSSRSAEAATRASASYLSRSRSSSALV